MDTIDVVKVTVLGHYLLQVEFSDRTRRDVDLQGDLQGGIFEALADPALFAQAYVDGPGAWRGREGGRAARWTLDTHDTP